MDFNSQLQKVNSFETVFPTVIIYKKNNKTILVRTRERQEKISCYVVENEEKKTRF